MSQTSTTSPAAPLEFHSSADFELLLEEARKHLRDLSGRIWTDHNAHDPGITILEVLCFAIADLSYRTSFDVKDLMAGYQGNKSLPIDLPLADVALPNHPFTVKDLRKVLLDLSHPKTPEKLLLRNVWPVIATESEVPVFLVEPGKSRGYLSLEPNTVGKTGGVKPAKITAATDEAKLAETATLSEASDEQPLAQKTMYFAESSREQPKLEEPVSLSEQRDYAEAPKLQTATSTEDAPTTKGYYPTATALPANTAETKEPNSIYSLPGDNLGRPKPGDDRALIQLNGLYGLQLEFEEEREDLSLPYYLRDLNKNYFKATVQAKGQSFELSVLMPYWDEINWALKDLNPANANYSFALRDTGDPHFISVDKLNYDDHFYDYFAEVLVNHHQLATYIHIESPQRDNIEISGQKYWFSVKWMDWNELANGVKMNYTNVVYNLNLIEFVGIDEQDLIYDIQVEFKDTGIGKTYSLLTRVIFDQNQNLPNHYDVIQYLTAKFADLFELRKDLEAAIRAEMLSSQSDLYHHYMGPNGKLNTVFDLVYGQDGVWEYLGNKRNLCEDFAAFSASRVQEVALFGKINLAPGHNANQVLGEAYFRIDQFLNPLIKFHTLDEISQKGYRFDEIFNGPLLDHGFIEDSDLENLKRRSVIYTSDLIRILMDVEGIESVGDFSISSYIDNRLMGRKVTNCLNLTYAEVYRPRLSVSKSDLLVCIGEQVEELNGEQIAEWYLRRLRELKAAQLPDQPAWELSLPQGRNRNSGDYHSIQHDFPQIYGIGPFGLPADATPERQGKARQLKAFLLPFEQLLSNYLQQLSGLPELFSFNPGVDTTYPHAPLYEVPDVAPLFRPFLQSGGNYEQFKNDLNNAYRTAQRENESEEQWLNRRNRFLDHLLGRFAEEFGDYAAQLFNRHKELLDPFDPQKMALYQVRRQEEMERLIGDKIAFGQDLPQVSNERSRAFNYLETDQHTMGWASENISGYKRRLCRLLGIRDVRHRELFDQPDPQNPNQKTDLEGMHVVEHILLRPRTQPAALLPLQNESDAQGFFIYDSERDPYSFRVTVVLPRNAGRFADPQYREFTEQLIRQETPAHILVDIRWMTTQCGVKFEKEFATWLNLTHEIRPWLFQGIATPEDQKVLYSDKDLQEYFAAQDRLVGAMQITCKLSLEVFDGSRKIIQPLKGLIRYRTGDTDVFHFRVSEPGGQLVAYYRPSSGVDWKEVARLDKAPEVWFPVADLTGNLKQGLAGALGGEGQYKLVYSLNGESSTQILEVLPALAKPRIHFQYGKQFLLDKPGVVRQIDLVDGPNYLLHTQPIGGTLQVSVAGGPMQSIPFASISKGQWRLMDFHAKWGMGPFKVEYALNGMTASLEWLFTKKETQILIRALDLHNPDMPLSEASAANLTLLPEQNKLQLEFEPQGGSMRIFEGFTAQGIPLMELKTVGTFGLDVVDLLPSVKDKRLLVEYQLAEGTATLAIEYRGLALPEVPELTLFANKIPQTEYPVPIEVPDEETTWRFQFQPLGGVLYFYKMVEGKRVFFGKEVVSETSAMEELAVADIFKSQGGGLFEVEYVTNGGKAMVSFELISNSRQEWTYPGDYAVVDFPKGTEVPLDNDVPLIRFDFRADDSAFEFRFRAETGHLELSEGEEIVAKRTSPESFVFRADHLPMGNYDVNFQPTEGEALTFPVKVINLDPRFVLDKVVESADGTFTVLPKILRLTAKTYVWRLNDVYTSRARSPELSLIFSESSSIEIQLQVFADGENELFEMWVTADQLRELSNVK